MLHDFCDLNKACPKNELPLANIEMLVNVATSDSMFFFMDGFNCYSQIKMIPLNTKKTTFQTPMGNCYYTVMLFALKNTEATYQRAVTVILHDNWVISWRIILIISLWSQKNSEIMLKIWEKLLHCSHITRGWTPWNVFLVYLLERFWGSLPIGKELTLTLPKPRLSKIWSRPRPTAEKFHGEGLLCGQI